MRSFVLLVGIAACLAGVAVNASKEKFLTHLKVSSVNLPQTVLPGQSNWRIRTMSKLTTRLFNSPLPNGDLIVGWTDVNKNGHVSYLKLGANASYTVQNDVKINGLHLRGVAALSDASFGVLAWYIPANDTEATMYVQKWSSFKSETPSMVFQKELRSSGYYPNKFSIGDSRMELDGNGLFHVYYHTHSDTGHEGDTYWTVNSATGDVKCMWSWGCSHSMSNLLSYHPILNTTLPVCVTDCYPGTTSSDFATYSVGGLYVQHRNHLYTMAGGCNGCVGGEVGMIAPLPDGGWMIIFNSNSLNVGMGQAACKSSYNQDIGLAFVTTNKQFSSLKWLTATAVDENDPGLARYGAFCGKGNATTPCSEVGQDDQIFLVGWKQGNTKVLGFMGTDGDIIEGPYNVSVSTIDGVETNVTWGARDDTWRTLNDGSIVWLEVPNEKSNVLRVFTLTPGYVLEPNPPSEPSSGFIVDPCCALVAILLSIFLSFF